MLLALALLAFADAKPKVFGVGLSRTGTSSLGEALIAMGYNNIHNDRTMIPFLSGEETYNFSRYEHVDSVEDLPSALYYQQLAHVYPSSKFVLTVRDEDSWFSSVEKYIAKLTSLHGGQHPYRVAALLKRAYGSVEPEAERWKQHFRDHNAHVLATIPSDRLLVMNIADKGEGYEKLCPFLDHHEGPCAETPAQFPKANELAKITELVAKVQAEEMCHPKKTLGNAYATFMADISDPKLRNYFLSALALAKSIRESGSKADFVVQYSGPIHVSDKKALEAMGARLMHVGPVGRGLTRLPKSVTQDLAAIYRNKMRVLQLVEYDRVIFLDADMVVVKNMDHLFTKWSNFVGLRGYAAPLNSGFFVFTPTCQAWMDMNDIASTDTWTPEKGWMEWGNFSHPDGSSSNWDFHSSSSDQGLIWFYYFVLQQGNTLLTNAGNDTVTDYFVHFLGKNKPWNVARADVHLLAPKFREPVRQWYKDITAIRHFLNSTLQIDIGVPQRPTNSRVYRSRKGKQKIIKVVEEIVPFHEIFDPYPPSPPSPPSPSPHPPAPSPRPPSPHPAPTPKPPHPTKAPHPPSPLFPTRAPHQPSPLFPTKAPHPPSPLFPTHAPTPPTPPPTHKPTQPPHPPSPFFPTHAPTPPSPPTTKPSHPPSPLFPTHAPTPPTPPSPPTVKPSHLFPTHAPTSPTAPSTPTHKPSIPWPTHAPSPPTPPTPPSAPTHKPSPSPPSPEPTPAPGPSTCGPNCPDKCDKCICGDKPSHVNIRDWCVKGNTTGWNITSCTCIVDHESSGNGNAMREINGTYNVGLWAISSTNWTCNGGNAPCATPDGDQTASMKCAQAMWALGRQTWAKWASCKTCGVCDKR